MILAIVTSVGVSGRRDETAIVDAALAASPFAGKVSGVFGVKAAPCDRVGERWAKKRRVPAMVLPPEQLPFTARQRAEIIVQGCDGVLLIGGVMDFARIYPAKKLAAEAGKPCHWHVVRCSYDRWADPA